MKETFPLVEKTTSLVQEITSASMEQKNGVVQINTAIQQLNNITQQNATSSTELSSSAEELSAQADQLRSLISFFRLNGNAKPEDNNSVKEEKAKNDYRQAPEHRMNRGEHKDMAPLHKETEILIDLEQ